MAVADVPLPLQRATDAHDHEKNRMDRRKKSAPPVVGVQDKENEAMPHNVHEITESSSDESVMETPARVYSRTRARTVEQMADPEAAVLAEDNEEEGEDQDEMLEKVIPDKMRNSVDVLEPEELYKTKNVADMQYLFTNDKLKNESPATVLKADPFCIPRVTDNVPNYRPMLNPLSIFLGEDQLLPGNFRLDPSERPPNICEKAAKQEGTNESDGILSSSGSSSSSSSMGKQFRGKTSTFMGTMPRQTEFAEIPVSEKLFQNHELFRPLPPIPRVPTSPLRDDRPAPMNRKSGNRLFASQSCGGKRKSISFPTDKAATPASLSDAMLLSSIQHTLDVTTTSLTVTNGTMSPLDSAAESAPSLSEGGPTCHTPSLQTPDSIADTLTNYLPSRSSSRPHSSRPVDGQHFDSIGGNNPENVSMSYAVGAPGAFGSLLSAAEHQASTSYAGLGIDSGAAQHTNLIMQTFSSALGSIYITTPTHAGAGINTGLTTPQERSSEVPSRRSGARKPRGKNVFRPCTSPGCTKGARGKSGLCQKHGGGKRCATPNCPKGAQGSSAMCLFHGGGYRCTVEGCTTGARGTSGLCAKHGGYKKGRGGSAGKREPIVHGVAVKRIRTDDLQQQ